MKLMEYLRNFSIISFTQASIYSFTAVHLPIFLATNFLFGHKPPVWQLGLIASLIVMISWGYVKKFYIEVNYDFDLGINAGILCSLVLIFGYKTGFMIYSPAFFFSFFTSLIFRRIIYERVEG